MLPIDLGMSAGLQLQQLQQPSITAKCDQLEAQLDALDPEAKAVFDKLQGMGMSLNDAIDKCRQSDPASTPPVLSALASLRGKAPSQWTENDKSLMLSAAKVTILDAHIKDMKASSAPGALSGSLTLFMQLRDAEMAKLSQFQRATMIDRIG